MTESKRNHRSASGAAVHAAPARPSRRARGKAAPRPVLITGGAGFVGSNMAERLLGSGQSVMILDNLSRAGVEQNVKYLSGTYGDLVDIHVADVRDARVVNKLVARCSKIFHFAAQVAVTTSLADPIGDFESNARGTLNVLEAARSLDPPPPLLFTSTNKVYGDLHDIELVQSGERYVPRDCGTRTYGIDESRRLDFHSPYGCSKGTADQYVLDYARMYGLPNVVFRMSCIYGRRQLGTEDQGWVAHFALQMLREAPVTIYGSGRQVRDVLYINDLLDAMLLAMDEIDRVSGKAFNIGGGPANAVSLLEAIGCLAELSGLEPEVRYGAIRQGDQPYYVSDTHHFTQMTGWTPQIPVEQGLSRLYQWILENTNSNVLQLKE
jgi:CDP-paratose 2-epimerase